MSSEEPLPTLETARLRLRPLAPSDAAGLHAAYGDPEAMRHWDLPPSDSLEQTAQRIEFSLSIPAQWHAAWAVVTRADGRFLGMVNYHHREAWNRRLEIGFILARPFWRQGFMREALGAFLAHCFEALDVHRVEATIEPDNEASRRLVEGLGFRCESGPLRDRHLVAGSHRDVLMYALLKPEWG